MNQMEVPQDYNIHDSFYQNKLLQSMGMNNSSANPYKEEETADEQGRLLRICG